MEFFSSHFSLFKVLPYNNLRTITLRFESGYFERIIRTHFFMPTSTLLSQESVLNWKLLIECNSFQVDVAKWT